MSQGQQHATPGWSWSVPPILKRVHEWRSAFLSLFVVISWIASKFLGNDRASVVAVAISAGAALLLLLLTPVHNAFANAIQLLESSRGGKAEDRNEAAKRLRLTRLALSAASVLLFITTLLAVVFAWWPSLYHWWFAKVPETVTFAQVDYYQPARDSELLSSSPFLEAVIGFLNGEGQAEGRKYRIVLGRTLAFDHPTPAFNCRMVIKDGSYEATGYAFRKLSGQKGAVYEAVPADYSQKGSVTFEVPPSDKGDELFVVVRVSLIKGNEFPSSLQGITYLQPLNPKEPR
jgi:hypothetical protein